MGRRLPRSYPPDSEKVPLGGTTLHPDSPLLVASTLDAVTDFLRAHAVIAANVAGLVAAAILLRLKGVLTAQGLTAVRRDVRAHHPLVWFACAMLVWLTMPLAAGAAAEFLHVSTDVASQSPREQATVLAAGYGLGLAVAVVLTYLLHASAPGAGLFPSVASVVGGMLMLALAWPLVTCVGALATWIHATWFGAVPDAVAHPTLKALLERKGDPWVLTQAGLAVLAAPVLEEILYRGMLQSALVAVFNRAWAGVVLTSAIFAAAHVVGQSTVPWYAAVALFALSCCIGLALERTGRLGVAIGMHVAFNAVNVAIALQR
ncbi:MAG: CPBP family intramembrane glutamic endopeptidase [Phycisphaerae bacterium]|jgi:membrane protease YdiL (CAAX protease family)